MIDRIFALIGKKGIKQTELSKATGVSNSVISSWKKGLQKPSTDAIVKIAKYFDVSTDYLLTGEVSPYMTFKDKNAVNDEQVLLIPHELMQALHPQASKYGITQEMIDELAEFWRYVKVKHGNRGLKN